MDVHECARRVSEDPSAQTWEDPGHEHPEMKVMGDNDPVDVVEIGTAAMEMGSVNPVKPVGVYAMIDDGGGGGAS